MGKACDAFQMENADLAFKHFKDGFKEILVNYGSDCNGNPLYTWDDGRRYLIRCEICGGYTLVQKSEYHGMEYDSYYTDYFPVSGDEEAQKLNEKYDGFEIEDTPPGRFLICDGRFPPHWSDI